MRPFSRSSSARPPPPPSRSLHPAPRHHPHEGTDRGSRLAPPPHHPHTATPAPPRSGYMSPSALAASSRWTTWLVVTSRGCRLSRSRTDTEALYRVRSSRTTSGWLHHAATCTRVASGRLRKARWRPPHGSGQPRPRPRRRRSTPPLLDHIQRVVRDEEWDWLRGGSETGRRAALGAASGPTELGRRWRTVNTSMEAVVSQDGAR